MAVTINPAVSGSYARWFGQAGAFLLGVFLGTLISLASLLALVTVLSAILPQAWVIDAFALLITWAILHDLGLPLPMPYRSRQVPEAIRNLLPQGAVALVFGIQLGIGFLTLFTYSTQLAFLLALPFLGPASRMLMAAFVFAIGKSVVLGTTLGISSIEDVAPRFRWSKRRMAILRATTASASLLLVVGLVLQGG